jgi:lactate permease
VEVKDLIDWLLAFSPILVVLVLMLGLRWGGTKAGPAGCLVAMLVAWAWFGAGLTLLGYAQLKGLLLTLYVLYIVWMALLFYHTVNEAGAVETIGLGLPQLTTDRALQALLLGWTFSAFLQGAGGFGVPVAVIAPLLVSLGFPQLTAVVIPSLGHAWAVSFGSLGSSFYALMASTGFSGAELAPWGAVMLGLCCLMCGAAVLWVVNGWGALRKAAVPLLVVGLSMALMQYLVVTNGFWELGGLTGGLAGLMVFLLLLRLPAYRTHHVPPVGRPASQSSNPGPNPNSSPNSDPDANPSPGRPSLLMSLVPYGLLIMIIIFGQLIVPVRDFLGQVVIRVHFPELHTSRGWVVPAGTGRTIDVFGHAGALLFYASVFSFLVFRAKGYYRPGAVERILRSTVRRAIRSSIGIATMVGMAVAMQDAGMTYILAKGVADVVGVTYPVASPYIGALGAFMTGSNTNSNVIFGPFQRDAARLLGLSPLIILAAQTAGGALGSMFAPAKVIVGASTAGLGGKEGPVVRKLITFGVILVGLVGLATWVAVRFVG